MAAQLKPGDYRWQSTSLSHTNGISVRSSFHLYLLQNTFRNVEVEEIAVEYRLHQTSHNGNEVEEPLKLVAPNPVEQVEGTVDSQSEEVMTCDGLCLTCFTDHEELWQNSH